MVSEIERCVRQETWLLSNNLKSDGAMDGAMDGEGDGFLVGSDKFMGEDGLSLLLSLDHMADDLSSLLLAPWTQASDQMTSTLLRSFEAVGDQLYQFLDGQRPIYNPSNPPKQIFVKKTLTAPSKFNKGYQGISRYLAAARTRTLAVQQSNFWLPTTAGNALAIPSTFQKFLDIATLHPYDLASRLWGTQASPLEFLHSETDSKGNDWKVEQQAAEYRSSYCRLMTQAETSILFDVPMEFVGICMMQHGLTPLPQHPLVLPTHPIKKPQSKEKSSEKKSSGEPVTGLAGEHSMSRVHSFGSGGLADAKGALWDALRAISGATVQSSEYPYLLIAMAMVHDYSASTRMYEMMGRLKQRRILEMMSWPSIKQHGMVAHLISLVRLTSRAEPCPALLAEMEDWKAKAEGRFIWPDLDRTVEFCRTKNVAGKLPRLLCPVTELLPITELSTDHKGRCIPPSFVCGSTSPFCEIAQSAIFFSLTNTAHCHLANRLLPYLRNWNIVADGDRKVHNWLKYLYGEIGDTQNIFELLPKTKIAADATGPFLPPLQWDTVARHTATNGPLPPVKLHTPSDKSSSLEPLITSEPAVDKLIVTYKQTYGGALLSVCFRRVCLNWYVINGRI
ncbi:hypothetical protein GNI_014620 [Gregarina niphandrodes]|uniref:Uncharacterized protein n=1 Tax=Gregarina niphandrodes TaxID=110365 RepID=A0A023BCJ2_GRENI|nr:hypothetical protein GNI_014620 [Gregarina niphandrodes]EZG83572.1 hypothetical protein GNI_014620 [Gregarina niphandrodes]|eukprot:XP_011128933.1 hypothetical protein GNI_014620 [Gregarina niphandrodes]